MAADVIVDECGKTGLELVILGECYKPDVPITTGSCVRLLLALLKEKGIEPQVHDPLTRPNPHLLESAALFFMGTPHCAFNKIHWQPGSVVIDPWRKVPDCPGVRVRRLGE